MEKQHTGQLYVQCLLSELDLGQFKDWIQNATAAGDLALKHAIKNLFAQLVAKIKNGERWTLADTRYGSDEDKRLGRAIAQSHPKEMIFALRQAINSVRQSDTCESSLLLPKGYFQRIPGYKDAEKLLVKRTADAAVAEGKEADQRREIVLYDMTVQSPLKLCRHYL